MNMNDLFIGRQTTLVERGERLDVKTELVNPVMTGLVVKLEV